MTENIKVLLAAVGVITSLVVGFFPHVSDVESRLEPFNKQLQQVSTSPIKLSNWYDVLDKKKSVTIKKGPVLEFVTSMFRVPHIWTKTNITEAFSFKEGIPIPRQSLVAVKKNKVLNLERAGKNIEFSGKFLNSKIENAIQDWRKEIDKLPEPIQEKASLLFPYLLLGVLGIGLYSLFLIKKLGKSAIVVLTSVGAWYVLALISLILGRHESMAQIPFSYVGFAAVLGLLIYRLPIPMYSGFFIKLGLVLLGVQWGIHQFPAPSEAIEIVLYQGAFGAILTGIASWSLVLGSLAITKQCAKVLKRNSKAGV